jgi:hypothetical protein
MMAMEAMVETLIVEEKLREQRLEQRAGQLRAIKERKELQTSK